MYPNMCPLERKWQHARCHKFVLVCLMQKRRLRMVTCLRFHKVGCVRPRPHEGTCLLLALQLVKPMLLLIPFLIVYYEASMTPPYFLFMLNMLLGMCGNERYIYLLLCYICLILIKLRLILVYLFLEEHETVKFVNHVRKILNLEQDVDAWFQDCVCYSGFTGLCSTGYMTINHGMWAAFVKRWCKEKPSFHITHGEMSIILDDVSCLLHFPIRGILLNHSRIGKYEALELMVNHLRTDPGEAQEELDDTR